MTIKIILVIVLLLIINNPLVRAIYCTQNHNACLCDSGGCGTGGWSFSNDWCYLESGSSGTCADGTWFNYPVGYCQDSCAYTAFPTMTPTTPYPTTTLFPTTTPSPVTTFTDSPTIECITGTPTCCCNTCNEGEILTSGACLGGMSSCVCGKGESLSTSISSGETNYKMNTSIKFIFLSLIISFIYI